MHKSTDFTLQFVSLCKKILHRLCAILQKCSVWDDASGRRIFQPIAETSLYKRPLRRESYISRLSPKARQCHRLSLFRQITGKRASFAAQSALKAASQEFTTAQAETSSGWRWAKGQKGKKVEDNSWQIFLFDLSDWGWSQWAHLNKSLQRWANTGRKWRREGPRSPRREGRPGDCGLFSSSTSAVDSQVAPTMKKLADSFLSNEKLKVIESYLFCQPCKMSADWPHLLITHLILLPTSHNLIGSPTQVIAHLTKNVSGSLTTLLIAHLTTLDLGDHLDFYVWLTGLFVGSTNDCWKKLFS